MKISHLLDLNDLTNGEWDELIADTQDIYHNPGKYTDACRGRILATLFYEPSTRTMFSFQSAMLRLGGRVIGFSEPKSSSVSKGEDLHDTIKIVSGYADLIVMRHPLEGAAMAASLFSSIPIINAGDGGHLHPTQTLTDLVTIEMEMGRLDNMKIGICGDLKNGRTVHSLIKAMSRRSGISFTLISPESLKTPEPLIKMMRRKGIEFNETSDFEGSLGSLDILYMTRIQKERFSDLKEYEALNGIYILDEKKMKTAKKDMLVLHPLPRVDEISHDVDNDIRAKYFNQAKYGMYARMALILKMLKGPFLNDYEEPLCNTGLICTNPNCITNHEHYLKQKFKKVKSINDIYYCAYCEKQYELSD